MFYMNNHIHYICFNNCKVLRCKLRILLELKRKMINFLIMKYLSIIGTLIYLTNQTRSNMPLIINFLTRYNFPPKINTRNE